MKIPVIIQKKPEGCRRNLGIHCNKAQFGGNKSGRRTLRYQDAFLSMLTYLCLCVTVHGWSWKLSWPYDSSWKNTVQYTMLFPLATQHNTIKATWECMDHVFGGSCTVVKLKKKIELLIVKRENCNNWCQKILETYLNDLLVCSVFEFVKSCPEIV